MAKTNPTMRAMRVEAENLATAYTIQQIEAVTTNAWAIRTAVNVSPKIAQIMAMNAGYPGS